MHMLKFVLAIDTRKQILLVVIVALSVILSFAGIRIEGLIVDQAIEMGLMTGQTWMLFQFIGLYFIIILMSRALAYFSEVVFSEVSQKTLMKIRTDLFSHILRLNIGFFNKTPIGDIISRIVPEVQQLGMFLSQIVLVPVTSGMTILAGVGLVTLIDWRLGIISIAIYSCVFIFLPRLRARLKDLSRDWSEKLRSISSNTEESISHYQEIQCNNTFSYEEDKFRKNLLQFWGINMDLARVHGKTTFLSQFFASLATLSVYGVGGYLAIKTVGTASALSVGSIFVMIRALGVLITPVNKLIDFSQGYAEALVKFDMVNDYLKIPPEMVDRQNAKKVDSLKGEVEVHNVVFGFEPEKKLLKNISMRIRPGERIALVGPAGCGKSTLSLLLNRMMKTNLGEITLDGINVIDIALGSLRKTVGYVAQSKTSTPILFSGTLADNILYGLMRKQENSSALPTHWLDLESAGIANLEELRREIMQIIRDVNFYDDVFNFGLTGVNLDDAMKQRESIFSIEKPDIIRAKILDGRKKFREKIEQASPGLVEFFDQERFMNYCSLLENLIFTSQEPFMKDQAKYRRLREVLDPLCRETGIMNAIFDIGCRTTIELSDIFKRVKPDSTQLMRRFQIPQPVMKNLASVGERMKQQGLEHVRDTLPPPAKDLILRLGFEYSAASGIDAYIDDSFKEKVIHARKLFREKGPLRLEMPLHFYEKDTFVDGASLMENLIMGKISSMVYRAEETISGLLKEFVDHAGLEDLVVQMGLLMDVGERGSKLSGGQAQKAAISRVLLKKPDMLILDEATSALDNASQRIVQQMLEKRFSDRNVITIAHRLDTIKEYDRILVMRAGEIVEEGNFEELMQKRGLFCELWENISAGEDSHVQIKR